MVIIARHLAKKEVLDTFAHQVRLIRGRFGSYEPIDFLALLIGYAISGERTLADFFERPIPFGTAFMALFGRHSLPHRSSLSRFLAGVDRPCLEAFRTLFEQSSFAEGWTNDSLGGIWDRHGLHYLVFDVDATRQAARQRALPHDPTLPRARRQQDGGLCARLHGAKTRGGRPHPYRRAQRCIPANGSAPMQAEAMATIRVNSTSALQAITTYLKRFALPPEVALVRLDGQYGDVVALAQLLEAGVYLVTRARGYQVLEHPQILRVLAYPPTASVTRVNSDEVVELFDGGWLQLAEGLPQTRIIVARHGYGKENFLGQPFGTVESEKSFFYKNTCDTLFSTA